MLRKVAVGFLACVMLDLAFSSYLCSQRAAYVQLPVVTHREKSEKDEIVKSAIELRKSEIEDGYTEEVSTCRQVAHLVQQLRGCSFARNHLQLAPRCLTFVLLVSITLCC